MSRKSMKFGDEKVNKSNFYKNKKPFNAEDIDINKTLVSKKETYGENHVDTLLDIMMMMMMMLLDHYA